MPSIYFGANEEHETDKASICKTLTKGRKNSKDSTRQKSNMLAKWKGGRTQSS
jgi:hypothetical protein